MRSAARSVLLLAISYLLFAIFISPPLARAQTVYSNTPSARAFTVPNVDSDVPQNQHTYTQAVTIEVLSAVICQITGIDPVDPSTGCLGINPQTRKLGLAQPPLDSNGKPQLGGVLGSTTDMIAYTYRPVVSTSAYTQYLSENFGIVKKAHAATDYGFDNLKPILGLWMTVRNISYMLLTIAFIFIGVGIMLRVKIDPRTVMSIQNQIPKIIIAIILITFSYAMSAVLIDLMWVTTYAGINVLSEHFPKDGESLAQKANKNLLTPPLLFANQIFETPSGGIFHITQDVSNNVGELLRNVVKDIFRLDYGDKCFNAGAGNILKSGFNAISPINIGGAKPLIDFRACLAGALAFFASIVVKLVLLVVLVITLFKIWFTLLKAYLYTIMYVIISPVMIVFGLLPTKPLGFENWLRRFFVNIAVFPLTAFMIVAARLLMDLFDTKTGGALFVPPLVGNPNPNLNFGAILAFGALLITPQIQTILREKMGVKNVGTPGIMAAGIAGGAAVIGAPVGRAMKHLNRYDQRSGDIGALAKLKRVTGDKTIGAFGKLGIKRAKAALDDREQLRKTGSLYPNPDYERGKANTEKPRRTWRGGGRRNRGGNGSGGSQGGSGGGTGESGGSTGTGQGGGGGTTGPQQPSNQPKGPKKT